MGKNRKKGGLFAESGKEGTLMELLNGIMIFVNLLRNDENIQTESPDLLKMLDRIARNKDDIEETIRLAEPVMLDVVKGLGSLLSQATNMLKQFKFDDLSKNLGLLSTFFSPQKRLKPLDDQKLLGEIEKSMMRTMEGIRSSVSSLLLNTRPKELSDVKGFTDSSIKFSSFCQEKLFNLLKKMEKLEVDDGPKRKRFT